MLDPPVAAAGLAVPADAIDEEPRPAQSVMNRVQLRSPYPARHHQRSEFGERSEAVGYIPSVALVVLLSEELVMVEDAVVAEDARVLVADPPLFVAPDAGQEATVGNVTLALGRGMVSDMSPRFLAPGAFDD